MLSLASPKVHQHTSEKGDQGDQNGRHADAVAQVVAKSFDFLFHMRIEGMNLLFSFFPVKKVRRPELNLVLHQYLICFQHFNAKINIQEKHGRKKGDDDSDKQ
jgi:hypothetical protein